MIIIHGGADQIVPPEQAKHMDAALRNAGVPTTLTIVPTAGHPLGSSVRRSDVLIQAFATLRIWRESSLAP